MFDPVRKILGLTVINLKLISFHSDDKGVPRKALPNTKTYAYHYSNHALKMV